MAAFKDPEIVVEKLKEFLLQRQVATILSIIWNVGLYKVLQNRFYNYMLVSSECKWSTLTPQMENPNPKNNKYDIFKSYCTEAKYVSDSEEYLKQIEDKIEEDGIVDEKAKEQVVEYPHSVRGS